MSDYLRWRHEPNSSLHVFTVIDMRVFLVARERIVCHQGHFIGTLIMEKANMLLQIRSKSMRSDSIVEETA